MDSKTNYYAILFLIVFAAIMGYSIVRAARSVDAIAVVTPHISEEN